ncbi:unnamed protein product [Rotaria socialis]|uniref:Uncharacterized protein n=1 Tax=Rotaria socialis TaxID=392032 RepID=A0A821V161_9BILA|nr:unnamed protein product [Rotaria socialis]CAF3394068.1 unnamed protein product [Rotaria socialis]CAF3395348.1 unnamed protein product [Rotaria socialis]CAF3400235.1 unnamed protein product [Rotaria socialis]CAF3589644.1 unnamed protein product [Rotaria socialis]
MILVKNSYKFYFILYSTLTILLFIPNTNALICYKCNNCPHPFDANAPGVTEVTAERGEVCGKLSIGPIINKGLFTVCVGGLNHCELDSIPGTGGAGGVCCCNDRDLCNGLPSIQPCSILTVAAIVVAFCLYLN